MFSFSWKIKGSGHTRPVFWWDLNDWSWMILPLLNGNSTLLLDTVPTPPYCALLMYYCQVSVRTWVCNHCFIYFVNCDIDLALNISLGFTSCRSYMGFYIHSLIWNINWRLPFCWASGPYGTVVNRKGELPAYILAERQTLNKPVN